jgi:hypothetical protein
MSKYNGLMVNLIVGEDVARRIQHTRKTEARSMSWLSETTGIPYPTLRRRLERKPDAFTLGELFHIAEALHTSVHTLISSDAA